MAPHAGHDDSIGSGLNLSGSEAGWWNWLRRSVRCLVCGGPAVCPGRSVDLRILAGVGDNVKRRPRGVKDLVARAATARRRAAPPAPSGGRAPPRATTPPPAPPGAPAPAPPPPPAPPPAARPA